MLGISIVSGAFGAFLGIGFILFGGRWNFSPLTPLVLGIIGIITGLSGLNHAIEHPEDSVDGDRVVGVWGILLSALAILFSIMQFIAALF